MYYVYSVLTVIFRLVGSLFTLMGPMGLFKGIFGILPAIGIFAVGIGMNWLAIVFSKKKESAAQQNAAQTASSSAPAQTASSSAPAQTASSSAPAQTAYRAAPAPAYTPAQPVVPAAASAGLFPGTLFMVSGILFLLALAFTAINFVIIIDYFGSQDFIYELSAADYLVIAGLLMLGIGAFLTRRKKAVSILTAVGFLCMTAANGLFANRFMQLYTGRRWIGLANIPSLIFGHQDLLFAVLTMLGYLLMAILTILMMRANRQPGKLIRWLWIPALLLVISGDLSAVLTGHMASTNGLGFIIALVLTTVAMNLACRVPSSGTAAPAPGPAAGGCVCPYCGQLNAGGGVICSSCGQRVMRSQPVRQAAPVQDPKPGPNANAQAAPKNIQKEMEACKDLLDCGILSQEEYDRRIRDLMRG